MLFKSTLCQPADFAPDVVMVVVVVVFLVAVVVVVVEVVVDVVVVVVSAGEILTKQPLFWYVVTDISAKFGCSFVSELTPFSAMTWNV